MSFRVLSRKRVSMKSVDLDWIAFFELNDMHSNRFGTLYECMKWLFYVILHFFFHSSHRNVNEMKVIYEKKMPMFSLKNALNPMNRSITCLDGNSTDQLDVAIFFLFTLFYTIILLVGFLNFIQAAKIIL